MPRRRPCSSGPFLAENHADIRRLIRGGSPAQHNASATAQQHALRGAFIGTAQDKGDARRWGQNSQSSAMRAGGGRGVSLRDASPSPRLRPAPRPRSPHEGVGRQRGACMLPKDQQRRQGDEMRRTLRNPMSSAWSRKHWRHMKMWYFRTMPVWLEHTRLHAPQPAPSARLPHRTNTAHRPLTTGASPCRTWSGG